MDRNQEIAEKRRRVREFIERASIDGVLLDSQALFAWYTGGGENRVALAADGGAAKLIITRDRDYVLANNIEAPRLEAEALAGCEGLELVVVDWPDEAYAVSERIAKLAAGRRIAAEGGRGGSLLPASFAELTYALTEREVERYRALGADCSAAMETACRAVSPGASEHEIAAVLAKEILARDVIPQVLLAAADERIARFRHPLATGKRVESCFMAVCCGKRGGLIASLTRLVHFGPLPEELERKHAAVGVVDAALIGGTRPGRVIGEIFAEGQRAYAHTGFPEEWRLHHQGGPTGYQARSFRATPDEQRKVLEDQAFAWNPSIAGTKSEDTILARADGPEILTATKDWPTKKAEFDGKRMERPDILVR